MYQDLLKWVTHTEVPHILGQQVNQSGSDPSQLHLSESRYIVNACSQLFFSNSKF